jgi:uncharacterized Zn-finger protein
MGGSMLQEMKIIETKKEIERCDGGGGVLGHPVVYLNLGKEGRVVCPYCSRLFLKFPHISSTGAKTKGLRRAS